MALNFSTLVYLPQYEVFARPIVVHPLASQPGLPSYNARGIYGTRAIDVTAQDGSIYSDQETIMDVREEEFAVVPQQLDRITIPEDADAGPALGLFEVTDADTNGGGETTLAIRLVVTAKPQ